MNKKLIIIRGYNGAGKSTLADKLSKKYNMYLLSYDMIRFGIAKFLPHDKKVFDLASKNIISCIDNISDKDESIVIEGHLTNKNKEDVFYSKVDGVCGNLEKKGYEVYRLVLIVDEKECYRRQEERGHIAPDFKKTMNKVQESINDKETIIDTTKLSAKEVFEKVSKVANLV